MGEMLSVQVVTVYEVISVRVAADKYIAHVMVGSRPSADKMGFTRVDGIVDCELVSNVSRAWRVGECRMYCRI